MKTVLDENRASPEAVLPEAPRLVKHVS